MTARRATIHPPPEHGDEVRLDWRAADTLAQVQSAVLARTAYRDEGESVDVVQTHISTVFLTPRYVFKFKRPLDLGFANFRTLADRQRYCEAEVRLNRRLAPSVYLDVIPLYAQGNALSLNEGERVIDYCVVMQRLPREDMLDERLRLGQVHTDDLEPLADLLARFHALPPEAGDVDRFGTLTTIRENWEENFRQTEAVVGRVIEPAAFLEIRGTVEDFLQRHEALFASRVDGGRIRDGHGDLRCEHVYLGPEGIRIIDCIEFNDRFRYGDVANDLAFLLMDLTAFRRPELARYLLRRYVEMTGDDALVRLVPFYACYRAYVRGKVASLKLADANLSPEDTERLESTARRFFRLAGDFARQTVPPLLVIMSGLTGSGKSAVAQALAERTGMAVFSSDTIRKELAREAAPEGRTAAFGAGIYSPEWHRRTYDTLLACGQAALREGRSVILDATFTRREARKRARALAETLGARAVVLECRLDERVALARLEGRLRGGRSISDGRPEIYRKQREAAEPVSEVPAEAHIVVKTEDILPRVVERLLADERLQAPTPLFGDGN